MVKKKSSKTTKKKQSSKKNSKKKEKSSNKPLSLKRERDVAMELASNVHKKFGTMVKASILFGSQAKKTSTTKSDIDVIFVIDDVSISWDEELIAWYREELRKLIASNTDANELHVNSIKLSTWWLDLMHGDPVMINILRYGEALIDIGGFFAPLKALLYQGKIHTTPEAIQGALQRAPAHLVRSKIAQVSSVEGVYWCMVDSAQAALMTIGKLPPSPEYIMQMLKENFVDKKILKMTYVEWYKDIFMLHKAISHGEVNEVKGVEIDEWHNKAKKFMLKMTEIIDVVIDAQRNKN